MRRLMAGTLAFLLLLPSLVFAQGENRTRIRSGVQAGEAGVMTSAPAGTEEGLVTRNIPSGTQPVSGTVSLGAGTANIGDVDVLTLPALPTGDNTIGRVKLTDGTDVADVTAANALKVDGSAVTQPVSAASLPLPSGAATSALQDGILKDGTGDTTQANVSGGRLQVDGSGVTQPVSGAVTATQGTAAAGSGAWPITVTNTADTIVKPGDAGNNAVRVNIVAGAGSGGTAQADESAFTEGTTSFTPIGGVLNDTITSDPTEDQAAAVRITAKRAIHVNLRDAAGAEVSVGGGTQYDEDTAATAAEKVTMAGVVRKDTATTLVDADGDRTELQVDASGRLWTNGSGVTQPVSGTVTANAGTNLNTSALALDATVGRAQASTTAGQTGPLIQGAVTTSAPTYTTAQTSPLSLTPAGAVRVDCQTGCAGFTDVTASGTLTAAAQTVTLALAGARSAAFALTGTWVATVVPEISTNGGTTYSVLDAWDVGGEAITQNVTANGQFIFPLLGGVSHVRVRASAYTSGTVTVTLRGTAADSGTPWGSERVDGSAVPNHTMLVGGTDGTNLQSFKTDTTGRLEVNQGTAAVGSGAWPVTVTSTADTVVKPGDVANNAIRVNVVAGAGSGGTAAADNSAFTGGTTNVTPMGALFDATPPSITDGNVGAPRMSSTRILYVDCQTGCAGFTDVTASGTLTAGGQTVSLALAGAKSAAVALTGTWVATVIPEVSTDGGTTYSTMDVWNIAAEVITQTITGNGQFIFAQVGGVSHVRVRASAYTSGTVSVAFRGTAADTATAWGAQRVDGGAPPNHTELVGGTDGTNLRAFRVDEASHLFQAPGIVKTTLAGWTSATSVNATQAIFTNHGTGAVLLHLVQGTTITAGAITFEVSYDNTNWVTIPADAVLDPASTTFAQIAVPYTLVASTNKPFLLQGKGWQGLRIKLSTAITGTGTVTPNYALLANEPAKSVIALSPTAGNLNAAVVGTGTAGAPAGNILTIQGVASMTKLLVTPDSVALPANQSVNVNQIAGTNAVTGGVAGTLGVGGIDAHDIPITGNPVLVGAKASAAAPADVSADNDAVRVWALRSGAVATQPTYAGALAVAGNGASGTGVQRVTIANDSTGIIGVVPLTTGGTSLSRTVSAASTNATNVKASAGQVYSIQASNVNAAARFIHLYNNASAPTCTASLIATYLVPASSSGTNIRLQGVAFSAGIGFCITTVNDGTGSVSASDVVLMIEYK